MCNYFKSQTVNTGYPKHRVIEKDVFLNPVDIYSGIKNASKYLKSQNVPRKYRKQILQSFDIHTIKIKIADDHTYGIRFYGGNSNLKGKYLFETFSQLTNRNNLALPYEWNDMTGIQQFKVREGTIIIVGRVAPQLSFSASYIGGAYQWFINDLENIEKHEANSNSRTWFSLV